MDDRNGYRKFLEIQVEALQEQLYALERDPEQVEHLKAMLRTVQRLRHAQDPGEPEPVRILRNAVEKVTLHIGRSGSAVTQDFLDFYVDSFELLEEAVRRWPGGPAFDRARYADRVRGLLETTAARGTPASAGSDAEETAPAGAWGEAARAGTMAEEPVPSEMADEIVLTEPEPDLQPASADAAVEEAPRVEVVGRAALDDAELDQFVEADLRDLLAEPWRGEARPAARPAGASGGGLAASYAAYESMRAGGRPGVARTSLSVRDALDRLRDVLDTFSVSLNDLDRAAERLMREGRGGLDRDTQLALADRVQAEKDKVLHVFDRISETFRGARV